MDARRVGLQGILLPRKDKWRMSFASGRHDYRQLPAYIALYIVPDPLSDKDTGEDLLGKRADHKREGFAYIARGARLLIRDDAFVRLQTLFAHRYHRLLL